MKSAGWRKEKHTCVDHNTCPYKDTPEVGEKGGGGNCVG